MLVASERLAPPVGRWLARAGTGMAVAACLSYVGFFPAPWRTHWSLVILFGGCALGVAMGQLYRRGGVGHGRRLRRLVRRSANAIEGTIRPIPGDPLAHAAPLAVQRPLREQPGYRSLSARAFDLELEDGRRVRVEPGVAILEGARETIPFGTPVSVSGAASSPATYREPAQPLRGTEASPLIVRVREPRRAR